MNTLSSILEYNKSWSDAIKAKDPLFFEQMAEGQSPEYLWIGCSDSRVEASRLTGLGQGEIFVHRNVANLFYPNDNNLSAVIQFAVEALKVKKIIICGHYCCGGVKAALDGGAPTHVDAWIAPIRDVIRMHSEELEAINDETLKWERLVELNALEQVKNVNAFPSVKNATHELSVHACVYSIKDGILHEIDQ